MTTVPTINEKILKLKQEIKDWEYTFSKNNNGTKPTQEDIKSNAEIQYKYKKYNKYKKDLKYQQEKENFLTTPTKQKSKRKYATPQKKDEPPLPPSPFPMKEIGPTPQLQGRVLSIFDIPVKSPIDKVFKETVTSDPEVDEVLKSQNEDMVFKTPSKKRTIFVSSHHSPAARASATASKKVMETPAYLRRIASRMSPVKPSSQEEVFKLGSDGVKVKSPMVHTPVHTPKNSSVLLDFNVEPSPMLSPIRINVKRKSLFEMMNELNQIQDDVIKYEKDEEDLNKIIAKENQEAHDGQQEDEEWNLMNGTEDQEIPNTVVETIKQQDQESEQKEEIKDDGEQEQEPKRNWKRAKTQKRSTKRRKIKPLQLDDQDELINVDIHDELKRLDKNAQDALKKDNEYSSDEDNANHNEMILNNLEDEKEEEESSLSEEEKYDDGNDKVNDTNTLPQQEKFKLLNTNFVRMKIHYKNRGKFKRGRR